jgi:hypothetical protein
LQVGNATYELTLAEEALSRALSQCRQINMVEMEADILLDVARLYYAYGSRYGGSGRVDRGLSSHEVAYRNQGHTETSDEAVWSRYAREDRSRYSTTV